MILPSSLAFRLERSLGQKRQGFCIGHLRAVHLVVEYGIGHGPQVPLELMQTLASC